MSLDPLFTKAEKALDDLVGGLSEQIKKSAGEKDFNAVATFTKAAGTISSLAKTLSDEQARFNLVSPKGKNKSFTVFITPGALKYSYLSVTEGMSVGMLSAGQVIQIKLPDGQQFTTKVMQANRLQNRKDVAKFFKSESVKPGDPVLMTEIQPGMWSLTKL